MALKPDKIRILHTIRQGKIGGGETHVLDLVASLDPAVFTSEVISFTDGEMVRKLKSLGIKCSVIPTEKPFDFRVWPKVKAYLTENNIDVVHAHGTRACSNCLWAANKLDIPVLYTIHGWSFHQDQSFMVRQIREMSEKYLVHRTAINISVSQSNNRDGIERIGMPHSRVVNYGINLDKFAPEKDYPLSRKGLNVPTGKVIAGMVARLTVQKDPITFIKAAKEVLQKETNIHFLIVGGGELLDECTTKARDLGIEEHITFEEFRTDVPAVLKLIDIYCLPSLWEGLPIGVLEAMAMKKAIVATPVDGTKEVITDGKTGLLFKEYDHHAMAACIAKFARDENKRLEAGASARKVIEEKFGVARMAREVGELYKEVLTPAMAT